MDVWTSEGLLRQGCWCLSHKIIGDPSLLCIVPCGLGGICAERSTAQRAVGVSDTLAGTQMVQTRLAIVAFGSLFISSHIC